MSLMSINHISFPGLGIDEFSLNSNAIEIGKFKIAWYGIIIMFGIICAILYVWLRFKENSMSSDDLIDLAFFTVFSGVIGARLYYVIFNLDYYIVTTQDGFFANLGASLGRIVAIWNGGLAIYGGIIAGGIAAVLVAKHKKIKLFKILDFLAPAVMIAQSIGRWGNFFNAEAHGSETTLPWRMGIRTGYITRYYHPTFFYESLWNLIGFLIIHFVFVKKFKKFDGQIFYMYIAWYGFGRMLIEGLRTDSLYLGPIRISQLVGALAFVIGTAMLVYNYIKLGKESKNG